MSAAAFDGDSDSSDQQIMAPAASASSSAFATLPPSDEKNRRNRFCEDEIIKIVDAAKFLKAYGESRGEIPSLITMTATLNASLGFLKTKKISSTSLCRYVNGSTVACRKIGDRNKGGVKVDESASTATTNATAASATDAPAPEATSSAAADVTADNVQILIQPMSSSQMRNTTDALDAQTGRKRKPDELSSATSDCGNDEHLAGIEKVVKTRFRYSKSTVMEIVQAARIMKAYGEKMGDPPSHLRIVDYLNNNLKCLEHFKISSSSLCRWLNEMTINSSDRVPKRAPKAERKRSKADSRSGAGLVIPRFTKSKSVHLRSIEEELLLELSRQATNL